MLADYLMAIRNEVVHTMEVSSLDPSARAFPASSRVDALIAEVRASRIGERVVQSASDSASTS